MSTTIFKNDETLYGQNGEIVKAFTPKGKTYEPYNPEYFVDVNDVPTFISDDEEHTILRIAELYEALRTYKVFARYDEQNLCFIVEKFTDGIKQTRFLYYNEQEDDFSFGTLKEDEEISDTPLLPVKAALKWLCRETIKPI